MRRIALSLSVVAVLLTACGGGQASEPEPAPTPVAPEPEPEPPPAPEPEHIYYQVFWQDIHVMTVYATPGPIRSEEPDNPSETFSGRSPFMSVISHYYEHEPAMATLIARAENLGDFMAILRAEGYEIEERELEEGY